MRLVPKVPTRPNKALFAVDTVGKPSGNKALDNNSPLGFRAATGNFVPHSRRIGGNGNVPETPEPLLLIPGHATG
jgi:hypothetical protein